MGQKPTDAIKEDEKKKKKPKKPIQQSRIVLGDELWEQVYNGKFSRYAVWNGGDVHYEQSLKLEGETIVPIHDDTLTEGAVILPTQAEDYKDTKQLLAEIRTFIHDYVDISPEMEYITSWYVLLTWVYDKLNTVCYLRVRGDTGVGKSRFEEVVGHLCYHTTKAAGCVTPAPIYRLIRRWRGTVIIDEADFGRSDETSEVVKILNCGFQRNTPVIRCDKNNPDKLQILPTFGPKILATRQAFSDKALESRCLTEIMQKTSRQDIPVDLPKEFYERAEQIRNKCLMYRFKNWHKIDPDIGLTIDLGDIEARIKQAVISFPALFHNDPDVMEEFKQLIKKHQQNVVEERAESYDGLIINELAKILVEKSEGLGTGDSNQPMLTSIIITPKEITERVNNTYFNGPRDKQTNVRTVGRHLKSLGIGTTKPTKVEGKTVRPIDLSNPTKLMMVFRGYISDGGLLEAVTSVTCVTLKSQEKRGKAVTSVTCVTSDMGETRKCNQYHINKTYVIKGQSGYINRPSPISDVTDVTNVTAKPTKKTPEINTDLGPIQGFNRIDKIYHQCFGCGGSPCYYEHKLTGKYYCAICAQSIAKQDFHKK